MKMFDRSKITLKPLSERENDLDIAAIRSLEKAAKIDERWRKIAQNIVQAKKNKATVILMAGGHVFRSGIQKYLIDLMEKGFITCLATNGACLIHDYEFALTGATTESVARYISEGQFGLWRETGQINDIINNAYQKDKSCGLGEVVGRAINEGDYPHKEISLFAAAYRLHIPATVHVGIGYDIIHELPNCDGAVTGALSYNDFLGFAALIERLEGGVVMNFGSAVMAPEVFLKALSMARNIAKQTDRKISTFTTVVCDLHDLPENHKMEPAKDNTAYYFRPWKTMLIRTTADGGESYYIKGKHDETIPALWSALNE
jgi:hypothetical protein